MASPNSKPNLAGAIAIAALALLFPHPATAAPPEVRVATFNMALSPSSHASLAALLADASSDQPAKVAEIVQRVAPDILLINELNYDGTTAALDALHDNFLAVSQNGQPAQVYPHRFIAASNTGEHSGMDFSNDLILNSNPGSQAYGNDCYGYGEFPGRYAMALLSKYPIDAAAARTMRLFLWRDMPGALLPDNIGTPEPGDFYDADERDVFRLSSKSHWDVPIDVEGHVVHLLGSHPTPPTFDGPRDRNGKRNHDEIRLWADYIDPARGGYLYDDQGGTGGLAGGQRFVIAGDQNADPTGGESVAGAIDQLLGHPLVDASLTPTSAGGGLRTSTFGLRVDYVLPSRAGLRVLDGAVYWPASGQPGRDLVSASDHRLVYMDLQLEPLVGEAVRDLAINTDGADLVLSWGSQAGVTYQVEASGDLSDGNWTALGGAVVVVDAGMAEARIVGALTDPSPPKFYRVGAAFE